MVAPPGAGKVMAPVVADEGANNWGIWGGCCQVPGNSAGGSGAWDVLSIAGA